MAADNTEDHKQPFHYEGGVPVFEGRVEALEREQAVAKERDRKYSERQQALNTRMVQFTGLLVLCSALTGAIGAYQAHVADVSAKAAQSAAETAVRTLQAIETSGTDTHDLAQAAKDQAGALKQQAKNSDRLALAAQLQAGASETMAKDATSSLQDSEKTFRDDQRAWVGVGEVQVIELEEGKPFRLDITVSNSGKTPALYVESGTGRRLSPTPLLEVPTPRDLGALQFQRAVAIPPQGKYVLHVSDPEKSPSPTEMLKSGAIHIYEYGKITYEDVYGRVHSTEFCVYLSDPVTRTMSFCKSYNVMN